MTETWEGQRERERAERKVFTQAFIGYVGEIAAMLGEGWQLAPVRIDEEFMTATPHITRASDGATFYLSADAHRRYADRVHVGACWPKDATGQEASPYFSSHRAETPPSMTFARIKTPKQAAADIARRFLPAFLPLWTQQAAVVVGRNDSRTRRQALAEKIAAMLGGKVRGPREPHDTTPYTVSLGVRDRGITDVDFDDDERRLKVTVRCSLEELTQLAEVLRREPVACPACESAGKFETHAADCPNP